MMRHTGISLEVLALLLAVLLGIYALSLNLGRANGWLPDQPEPVQVEQMDGER